jgi:hypothetical protein
MTTNSELYPNTSNSEEVFSVNRINPTATGFQAGGVSSSPFFSEQTYIYIAIRRGPMKVPTTGTSVFAPIAATASTNTSRAVGFPADMTLSTVRTISDQRLMVDRLRGYANTNSATPPTLDTTSTAAEVVNTSATVYNVWNTTALDGPYSNSFSTIWWHFRRAPGFFDVVCYTGTGANRTVAHNLAAVPELIITKGRNSSGFVQEWYTYAAPIGNTKYLVLQAADAEATYDVWNNTTPTASVFSLGSYQGFNESGKNYVAYLFATCPGVSKVFSFTGNGTTQTINCGFTGGARFVLLKASSATGGWYVYDTARGMTVLTDPYLQLNSTAAESATLGSVTTVTTGFAVNESILAGVNTSGVSYIGLAIA